MEAATDNRNSIALRLELQRSSHENAVNALWNYVSLLVWLRTLRLAKGILILVPACCGAAASWYAGQGIYNGRTVGTLAALAGLFPVIYVAIGIDERIGYYRSIGGRYRRLQSVFRDLSVTSARYSDSDFVREYELAFSEYKHVREEAHTVPKWCFRRAKSAIDAGEYSIEEGVKSEGTLEIGRTPG